MSHASLQYVNLDQNIVGHRKFLSCWVDAREDLAFLVDPGPTSSVDHFIAELKKLSLPRLNYILITHIHLDHAGGVAEVVKAFPGVRVLCHEDYAEHLVDPTRLWPSALDVLGYVAEAYGEPGPVPAASIAGVAEVEQAGISVVPTLGHAPHHLSFLIENILFVGEAVGLRVPIPGKTYIRPATPRRFILEIALNSSDRLAALTPQPRRMAFAHFDMLDNPAPYIQIARKQMISWVALVRDLEPRSLDDLLDRAYERLLREDEYFANITLLDADVQQRERHYLRQTLEGILDYVQTD